MLLEIVLLIAGLALIVFGAEWLVDGASSVARKAGLSEFVIGLTIVGFGTSCPELVVSLTGALQGNADVAVGNVVGSNLFNTLLILGVTALISPLVITRNNARRDIPIALLATIILVVMSLVGNNITRFEGAIMLILFALYIYSCFKTDTGLDDEEDALKKEKTVFISIILFSFTTILTGYYDGEASLKYFFKDVKKRYLLYLKIATIIILFMGCMISSETLWSFVDILVALEAIINIYALIMLRKDVIEVGKT